MKVVFMGTPDFAAQSLRALVSAGHDIACVVSQPDAAKDRGKKMKYTPVKQAAMEAGLRVLQPSSVRDEGFMADMRSTAPDIIVVAAYGRMLHRELLDLPRYGCINVHASLLPRYRGSAPIQHAILSGDEVTGVTIMQMAEGMDTGDMLAKVAVSIGRKNCAQLHDELAEAGAALLIQSMEAIESGTVTAERQNDDEATMAPMISKKDGLVDFQMAACEIERRVRAFYPWPGTYTYLDGEIFKIWEADVNEEEAAAQPGTVIGADDEGIVVACGSGSLVLKTVQAPGKRRMTAADYLKGNKIEISKVLG